MQNPVPTAVCFHDPLNYEAYHWHQFKFNLSNFKIFLDCWASHNSGRKRGRALDLEYEMFNIIPYPFGKAFFREKKFFKHQLKLSFN